MFKFENILVPTDFSEQFYISLNYAMEIAKSQDATLHILHVLDHSMAPANVVFSPHAKIVDVEQEIRTKAEKKLESLDKELTAEKFNVKTELIKGSAADEIIKYAEENKIDVICIATHGSSGIEHFLFGSTTEKVLRRANCPVLAIREPEYKKAK